MGALIFHIHAPGRPGRWEETFQSSRYSFDVDISGGAAHPTLATFPEGTASQRSRAMLSGVREIDDQHPGRPATYICPA